MSVGNGFVTTLTILISSITISNSATLPKLLPIFPMNSIFANPKFEALKIAVDQAILECDSDGGFHATNEDAGPPVDGLPTHAFWKDFFWSLV